MRVHHYVAAAYHAITATTRSLTSAERARHSLPEANVVSWIALKEAEMIYAGVEELKERAHREGLGLGHTKGRREGRAEGRVEGRATMAYRLAKLRFGADTAERLSRLMEGIADPDRIARISDGIIECETGAELLARARED